MEDSEPSEPEPEKIPDRNPEPRSKEETAREEKAVKEALRIFTSYGLNADRLLSVEKYQALSGGQRLLLAENFRQVAAERVEEKAKDRVDASRATVSGNGVVRDLFAKIRALMPRDDNMRMAGARRDVERDESWKENLKILSDLIGSMTVADFRPRVDLDKDGKMTGIRFLSDEEAVEFEKAVVRRFNEAARAFSRMPYEWSLADAKKVDRMRYRKAKEAYLEARYSIAGSYPEGEPVDPKLVESLARADRDVTLMRMFASDPDMENIIGKISGYADQSKTLSFLKTNVFEKGGYYAFGYLKPMLVAGTLGFLAVPAVSAALGGLRAYGRGRKELREAGRAGRRGAEWADGRQAFLNEYEALRSKKGRSKKEENRFRKLSVLFGDGFEGRFGSEFADLSARREEWTRKNGFAPWTRKEAKRYAMLESWKRDEEEFADLSERWRERTVSNGDESWNDRLADRYRELFLDRRDGYETSHPERRREIVSAYAEVFGTGKTYVKAGDRRDPGATSVKRGLSSKLGRLTEKVMEASEEDREKSVESLRARIAYTRKKLDDGLIDFGNADARTGNRTDLILALSKAEATVAALGKDAAGTELEERLDAFLEFGDRKRDAAEQAFMRKRMRDGAIVSATFGVAGSVTRYFVDVWQGESELLPKFLSGEKAAEELPGSGVPAALPDETVSAAAETVSRAAHEAGSATPESFAVTAKSGEGLMNLARHATDQYLEVNPDPSLTAEHRIYIEDYLHRHSGFSGTLHPDDVVEFRRGTIEEAVKRAKLLEPSRLENLSRYADRAIAFQDLPRSGPVPDISDVGEDVPAPEAAPSMNDAIREQAIREYVAADEGRELVFSRNMTAMRELVFRNFDSAAHGDVKAGGCFDRIAEHRGALSELSESDRAFARFVDASYGKLRDSVSLSDAEARLVLLPGKTETVDAYFERIAYVLLKKGISVNTVMEAVGRKSDADVIQFLGEEGLLGEG